MAGLSRTITPCRCFHTEHCVAHRDLYLFSTRNGTTDGVLFSMEKNFTSLSLLILHLHQFAHSKLLKNKTYKTPAAVRCLQVPKPTTITGSNSSSSLPHVNAAPLDRFCFLDPAEERPFGVHNFARVEPCVLGDGLCR